VEHKEIALKSMIRPMMVEDVPRVAEIHVFGQRKAYQGIMPDKFLFGTINVAKRMEFFKDILEKGYWDGYVYDDGIIRGFIVIGQCEDADKTKAFKLERIFVDPLMSGKGIGTVLEQFFTDEASKRGFNELCLWVVEGNAAAIRFYENKGYKIESVKMTKDTEYTMVRYTKILDSVTPEMV